MYKYFTYFLGVQGIIFLFVPLVQPPWLMFHVTDLINVKKLKNLDGEQ